MGREWFNKAAGGGDGGGRGGGKSPSPTAATKPMNIQKEKYTNTSSSGCMSVIYNLFDIQHHQFRFHHPSFVSESAIDDQHSSFCLQGIEAPRNSLESPESAMNAASAPLSSEVTELMTLNIPVGRIQIETKRSGFTDDLSSESCSSPGIKTPNLVARLMGLDLLPEYSSPRPSSSSTTVNCHHRSRSLPATPRLSTSSRHSTDNDYNHRLSLQVDKENSDNLRRPELLVHRQDDDRSSSQYAKHITNNNKERISRRLGTDITNTMSPARSKYQRRDSNLDLRKSKKSPAMETTGKVKRDEFTPLSSLPKVKLLDIKSNLNKPVSNSHSSTMKQVKLKCRTSKFSQTPLMKKENIVKDEKIKRIASERYDLRLKKMLQQEKVFVNKKSTSLPDHVLNVNNTKKFHSFKKDIASSSSPPTKFSQKQASLLPSNLNSSYNSNVTHNLNAVTATTATVSSGQWNSSSLPVSIFNRLEKLRQATGSENGGEVVERDIRTSMRRWLSTAVEAEVEGIVVEIEEEIFEKLVNEIALETVADSDRLSSHVVFT